jgi:hypothetical protein
MKAMGSRLLPLRVILVAAAVPVLMRLPLERLAKLVEPRSAPAQPDATTIAALVSRIDHVIQKGYPLIRNTCLTRGITRYWFLRRAGVDLRLAFGLGKPTGVDFSGHCWLVRNGKPFLETSDPGEVFTELYSIPAARNAPA